MSEWKQDGRRWERRWKSTDGRFRVVGVACNPPYMHGSWGYEVQLTLPGFKPHRPLDTYWRWEPSQEQAFAACEALMADLIERLTPKQKAKRQPAPTGAGGAAGAGEEIQRG